MNAEKMLEYLTLEKMLFNSDGNESVFSEELFEEDLVCLRAMLDRYFELEEEFKNHYNNTYEI